MVLGNSSTQLKISIIADMKEAEQQLNAFTTQIENVTKSAKSSSENLKGAIDKWIVGLTAVTAALVAATAKFTQSTLQIGGDFELSIVKLGGVAQASSEEMSMLEEKARELGETLPITASQAAGAMYSLASAGAKVNEIMNAINATTQLSISQNYDLGQSTDLMVATMRSFNMDFAEGMRVADVFNNTIRGSMMNMEKFSSAMVYVAKPAHDLGLSLEQTAAMMGVLADSGMRGEQVGTAMRALFTALMDLSDEGAAALARLGVTLTDSFGEMRDVTEVFEDLARSGMTAADALAIFDKRSFGAALTITGNIDRLRSFTTEVSRTGTTSKLVGDQMQTFNMRLEGLKSAIEEGFLVAYEGLQHASKKTVDSLRDMVLTFNDWARETKVFEQILSRLIFGLNGTVKGADAFREALQRINIEAVAQTVERVVRGVRQLAEGLYTLVSRIPWVKLYTFMEIFITPLIWAKIGALLLGFVATIGGLVGAGAKLVFWIKQFHGTLMHGIPFTQKAKEALVQMGLGAADASHGVEKLNLSGTNAQKSINAVGNASAYAAPAVSGLGVVSGGASVGVNALAMSNNAVIAGTAGMSGVVQNASTALQNVSLSATKGAISLENLTMVADAVNDGIRRVAASTTAMNSVLDGTGGKAFTEMSLGSQKLAISVAAMNGKLQRAKDELWSMMRAGSISAKSFETLSIHAMNLGIEQDKAAAALEKTNAAMAKTVHAANAAAGAEAKMGAAVTITTQALYKETMGLVANGNSRKAIDIQLANHLRANRITQAQYDQMVASLDRLNGAMMRLSEGYSISTGKLMVWLKYMTAKKVSLDVINAALARMHALQLINTEQLNLLGAMAEVAGLKTLILASGVSLTTKALAALKLAGLAVMPWLKMLGMMIVSVAAFSAAWKVVKWPFELMSKLKDRIEAANKAMREQQKEAMDAAYYASDYKKAIEGCNEALDRLPEKLKKAAKAERAQKDVLYELKEVVGSYEHIHAPLLKVLERLDDVAQEGYAAKIEGDLKKWQDEVDSLTSSYDDLQTVQSVGGMLTERDTEEAASILKRIEELQEKIRQNSIGALADEAEHYLDALPTIEKAVAGCVESFNSLDKEHQDHVTRVQKQIERTKELWEENFNGSETRALAAMIKQTLDATGGSFENTAKEIGSQWNGYIMAIASQGEHAVDDFKRKVFAEGLLDKDEVKVLSDIVTQALAISESIEARQRKAVDFVDASVQATKLGAEDIAKFYDEMQKRMVRMVAEGHISQVEALEVFDKAVNDKVDEVGKSLADKFDSPAVVPMLRSQLAALGKESGRTILAGFSESTAGFEAKSSAAIEKFAAYAKKIGEETRSFVEQYGLDAASTWQETYAALAEHAVKLVGEMDNPAAEAAFVQKLAEWGVKSGDEMGAEIVKRVEKSLEKTSNKVDELQEKLSKSTEPMKALMAAIKSGNLKGSALDEAKTLVSGLLKESVGTNAAKTAEEFKKYGINISSALLGGLQAHSTEEFLESLGFEKLGSKARQMFGDFVVEQSKPIKEWGEALGLVRVTAKEGAEELAASKAPFQEAAKGILGVVEKVEKLDTTTAKVETSVVTLGSTLMRMTDVTKAVGDGFKTLSVAVADNIKETLPAVLDISKLQSAAEAARALGASLGDALSLSLAKTIEERVDFAKLQGRLLSADATWASDIAPGETVKQIQREAGKLSKTVAPAQSPKLDVRVNIDAINVGGSGNSGMEIARKIGHEIGVGIRNEWSRTELLGALTN